MERLTEKTTTGTVNLTYPPKCYFPDGSKDQIAVSAYRQEALERLAAYEDTGLEPEDISDALVGVSPVCILCDGKTDDGYRTDKCEYPPNIEKCIQQSKYIAELVEAKKDGRLVVLSRNVEPVQHGLWVKKDDGECWYWVCSKCGEEMLKNRYGTDAFSDYCPNCGAKMDVEYE